MTNGDLLTLLPLVSESRADEITPCETLLETPAPWSKFGERVSSGEHLPSAVVVSES